MGRPAFFVCLFQCIAGVQVTSGLLLCSKRNSGSMYGIGGYSHIPISFRAASARSWRASEVEAAFFIASQTLPPAVRYHTPFGMSGRSTFASKRIFWRSLSSLSVSSCFSSISSRRADNASSLDERSCISSLLKSAPSSLMLPLMCASRFSRNPCRSDSLGS